MLIKMLIINVNRQSTCKIDIPSAYIMIVKGRDVNKIWGSTSDFENLIRLRSPVLNENPRGLGSMDEKTNQPACKITPGVIIR